MALLKGFSVDIGRSVQFVFQDPDWMKKVLIGGVLFLIPIIGWLIVGGYYLRSIQTTRKSADSRMPGWNDWGGDLVRGLKVYVVHIAYMSPLLLILCSSIVLIVAGEEVIGTFGIVVYSLIAFPYLLIFYFLTPLVFGRLANNEQIRDAFEFRAIIQEARLVSGQLLLFALLLYAIWMVASFGVVLCIVGVFFTSFLAYVISGHLVGQIRSVIDDYDGVGTTGEAESAVPGRSAR